MSLLKCKMCGGNLNITEGSTTCTCEYCGTTQTIPVLDDEKKNKLYERASRLRFNNEFDKAYNIYQDIINDFPQEAEAYWGLILCKYGIEYVEDPYTRKRIPTCHRSSFESIFDDELFEMVMENCSTDQRGIYRQEAKTIEEIRKGIIEVSNKEEPYDIFICYKETDENNNRTIDSVIAQDVYDALTEKGYRVFFSRISLEDKLGKEYEPYIFAALNSAKVMLVFGTKYEYFNAVWVKNEWSRFLQLIAKGEKKTLIPCYRDIDVYDMPKEFQHLQSQDMAKVGAIQDLIRGINKILPKAVIYTQEEKKQDNDSALVSNDSKEELLTKANNAFKQNDLQEAEKLYKHVLSIDPYSEEAKKQINVISERLASKKKEEKHKRNKLIVIAALVLILIAGIATFTINRIHYNKIMNDDSYPVKSVTVTSKGDGKPLYLKPSVNSGYIGYIHAGEEYTVYSVEKNYYTCYKVTSGWIIDMGGYVKVKK